MPNFDYYEMQRVAVCRGCSSRLEPGMKVMHTYTSIGKGMHIYFCLDCEFEMAQMLIKQCGGPDEFDEQCTLRKLSS